MKIFAFASSLVLLSVSLNHFPAQASEQLMLDVSRAIQVGECVSADGDRPLLVYRDGLLRVQTTGLGLLLGFGSSELAGRANCTVRIPYEVPAGMYIKGIASRLAYGVYKSADAKASISARLATSNISAQTTVPFEQGTALDEYFLVKSFQGESASVEQACRSNKGILRFDVSTSGQLGDSSGVLILESILGEVKVYSRFELAACPAVIQ